MHTLLNNTMHCAACGGTQVPTTITHHAYRGATIYVFEHVPAHVCAHCGKVWTDGQVLHHIDRFIDACKAAPAPVSDYRRLVLE
jgi:YgiT-type zinc finger domain-containing protein